MLVERHRAIDVTTMMEERQLVEVLVETIQGLSMFGISEWTTMTSDGGAWMQRARRIRNAGPTASHG